MSTMVSNRLLVLWVVTIIYFGYCGYFLHFQIQRVAFIKAHILKDAVIDHVTTIVKRGITNPSTAELLHNTIGFGVPSVILFALRLTNASWVIRKWYVEDYLMCLTMGFYVGLLSLINVSASYNTNLFPDSQAAQILADPTDVSNRIYGSKLVIPLEQCMLASTWCVKICIWFFLWRLCRQLPKYQRYLSYLMVWIIVGYITIQFVYYIGVCRPFSQYWAVPVTNLQCATYQHYSITQMVFNISSDLCLVIIPVCLFTTVRLPWRRKSILMVVFSMACFTVVAAILNKVYNFLSPMTTTYQLWYIRESSVAIWVGNVICCWQITQKLWHTRSFDNHHAHIVKQPEIQNPEFSEGGSPKDDEWWKAWGKKCREIGDMISRATTTAPRTNVTRNDLESAVTGIEEAKEPITLMTVAKDGDDAAPALAFRESEGIV